MAARRAAAPRPASTRSGWTASPRTPGKATPAALHWVAATLTIGRVSNELCESTDRISALVSAVKSYAYMDRGGLVEVDLHEGLETTLTVLGHKLKHTAICVMRDYDRTLPKMTVHGSELNQVWTNLLDNAIGALGERGHDHDPHAPRRRLRGRRDRRRRARHPGGRARADLRPVLHDEGRRPRAPAWACRPRGRSSSTATTALLTVESEPGNTTFRVRLPLTPT